MVRIEKRTPERRDVGRRIFEEEIAVAARPVIIRDCIANWPAVSAARSSNDALYAYIRRFDSGESVDVLLGPPDIEGRFFYRPDMRGVNFARGKAGFGEALSRLQTLPEENAPALYIQSAPVEDYLPGFEKENRLDLVGAEVAPRIWIGNALNVQTHFDLSENIACVVAGRKRFTLFPPEQIVNLYPGPLEMTLSGPPVSMAQLHDPDFDRYPRFRDALAAAEVAELGPGDALYVPYHWWHNVESLDPLNILVNFWWKGSQAGGSPRDCLLHGLLALRTLPPRQREIWRAVFDYYVFQTAGDPAAHLSADSRGVLGDPSPELLRQIRRMLTQSLSGPLP